MHAYMYHTILIIFEDPLYSDANKVGAYFTFCFKNDSSQISPTCVLTDLPDFKVIIK